MSPTRTTRGWPPPLGACTPAGPPTGRRVRGKRSCACSAGGNWPNLAWYTHHTGDPPRLTTCPPIPNGCGSWQVLPARREVATLTPGDEIACDQLWSVSLL